MADQVRHGIIDFNTTSSRYHDFCTTNPVRALHKPISEHGPTRIDRRHDDNQIPDANATNGDAETHMGNIKCCCGRPDCAYLEHNNAALGGLERDLETAARLGQALLDRHEAYVKESQAEQARLSSYISDLEDEKTQLQDANHKMVIDNRELLQKLEQLNTDFGESGKRVHELEDLLQDCELEIKRLNNLTKKTQDLELKVLDMERERAEITKSFEDGRSEHRSTIVRWRESERKVKELEEELRRIECAAKADRERHEELVARMERDRLLERELGLSEGRLKATAAVHTLQKGGQQKQVVSNFVRDILQDNANLQAGIAELRDLLQSSNDEVQNLREQVMLHQPIQHEDTPAPQRQLSLSDELDLSQSLPKPAQPALHVHHHYHTKFGSKKEKTPTRKTPKKRSVIPSGLMSSSPSSSGASTPLVRAQRYASMPSAPLTVQPQSNRWSVQSNATASTYLSSMASSPRSYFDRTGSIFDRIERGEESSRPTSPESFSISSPVPFKQRNSSNDQALSVFEEEDIAADEEIEPLGPVIDESVSPMGTEDATEAQDIQLQQPRPDTELTPKPSMTLKPSTEEEPVAALELSIRFHGSGPDLSSELQGKQDSGANVVQPTQSDALLQELEENTDDGLQEDDTSIPQQSHQHNIPDIRPSIRRSTSHDSLLSISGMDIHLAQHPRSTSSALRLLGNSSLAANRHHFAPTPTVLRQPLASAARPLAAVTEYTATSRHIFDSTSASIQALNGMRVPAAQTPNKGLMSSVGGWVSSKWGRSPTPMKSVADLQPSTRPSLRAAHFATSPAIAPSSASSLSANTEDTTTSNTRDVSSKALYVRSKDTSSAPSTVAGSVFGSSLMGRPPGINQSGPIPGFAAVVAAKRTPTTLVPTVNTDVLKESLMEMHEE